MTELDSYNKEQLIHIVDMYNLNIDIETLRKKKGDILKIMKKVPKKTFKDLPNKKEIVDKVKDAKKDKNSLISQVSASKDFKLKSKKKLKDMTADEKKTYNKLAKRESVAKKKAIVI